MPQAPLNPFAQRGQTDLMLLNQLSQGFAPVVTAPAPQMRTGFENLPGFSEPGIMGLIMNQFVAPLLQKQMGKVGLVPGGLSSQNILDYQDAQRFREEQKQILQDVSGRDEDQYYQTIRGMQALTGEPFNAPQRAAARRLASTAAGMTPSIAPIVPELIDALAGRTGSASVMAMRMQQFNRFRVDPVTGLTGYSQESNVQEAQQVFDEMYAPDNMAKMRGMRAGQMGQMYGEMMRRGMIGSDSRPFRERVTDAAADVLGGGDPTKRAEVRAIVGGADDADVDFDNLDVDQLDKLRGLESVQGGLRTFNADSTKQSLEGYIDAVTTMREIFGDAGISNAPMSQLIQGLEALSQGTLTQIDPGSLNMMVRTTQQLAKQSGMTIDAAIMMQQQGASTLQNLGMERAFAPQITQGAMAFGMEAMQAGVGANPAWGLENMDFQRQLDQNLRASAVAAPTTNTLAAMVRGEEQFGGFGLTRKEGESDADFAVRQATNKPFRQRAEAMTEAIREGRTEYSYVDENGDPQVASLSEDQFMVQDVLIQQGLNKGLTKDRAQSRALNILMATEANRETAFEFETGNLTRRLQIDEIKKDLIQPMVEGVLGNVEGATPGETLTEDQQRQAAESFADTMLSMDRETATDTTLRTNALAESLRGAVPKRATETDERYTERLRGLATELTGNIGERIKTDEQYRAYGSLQNLMVQQNEPILSRTAITQRRAKLDAGVRDAMTGLTGHGMLASLVGAVQKAGEDDTEATLSKVLGRTFGGVQADEISERLVGPMQEFQDSRDRVKKLETKLNLAKPDERRGIEQDLRTETRLLKERANQLRTVAEQNGLLDQEAALDIGDITAFEDAQETVRQNRLTSSVLLLRPDAGLSTETRVERAEREGGLLESLRLGADEDELLDELSEGQSADYRLALQRGEIDLEGADKLRILKFRQDAIRIAPTEGEVDTAMAAAGVADGDVDVRRLIAGAISTERRMEKTGVNREDIRTRLNAVRDDDADRDVLDEMDTAALDAELEGYNIGSDQLTGMSDEAKRDVLLSKRENEATEDMTTEALMGGPEALRQRLAAYESLSKDERDVIGRGQQDRFDTVQNLIEETANVQFIRRHGAPGLMLRDKLKKTQEVSTRLRTLFSGDIAKMSSLVGGGDLKAQGELADWAAIEIGTEDEGENRFFDASGKLKEDYAHGILGGFDDAGDAIELTREDFDRDSDPRAVERLSALALRDVQIQQQDNDREVGEIASQLKHVASGAGTRFTLEPSEASKQIAREQTGPNPLSATRIQALRSAYRLAGDNPDEATIDELQAETGITEVADAMLKLRALGKGKPIEAVERAALSGEDVTQASYDKLDDETKAKMNEVEFRARVEDYRTVDKGTNQAAIREREAARADPLGSLSAIGEAMGLEGESLVEFRANRQLGAKFGTGEGKAWARGIRRATTAIGEAAGEGQDPSEVYSAIRDVLTGTGDRGESMTALKELTGHTDVGNLLSQGRLLEHGGVLEELSTAGGSDDLVRVITAAMERLQESERTVEDVKEQHLTISGDLHLTGGTGEVSATGGLITSGVS